MKKAVLFLIFISLLGPLYSYEITYKHLGSKTWTSSFLKFNPKVTILLPKDYQTSTKKYPVIYVFDGQNLFDAKKSFSGEWKMDETLIRLTESGLIPEVIVVAIHNTANRTYDYTPTYAPTEKHGTFGGDLFKTESFILKELKPYIEKNYPASAKVEHNYLMGSSLGGLAALYIMGRNPQLFSGVACMSSSFFWDKKRVLEDLEKMSFKPDCRVYLDAGWKEEGDILDTIYDNRSVYHKLQNMGLKDKENLFLYEDSHGTHSESSWSKRLHMPLTYLLSVKKFHEAFLLGTRTCDIMVENKACDYQINLYMYEDPSSLKNEMIFTVIDADVSSVPSGALLWKSNQITPLQSGDILLKVKYQNMTLDHSLYAYPDTAGIIHREVRLITGDSHLEGLKMQVMSFNKQETNYFIPSSLTLSDKAIFRISYPSGSRIKFKILNKQGKEAYSKSDKLILRSLNFKDHRLTEISIDNWK